MKRTINLSDESKFNKWVLRSIKLFNETSYLDDIAKVYPFSASMPYRLDSETSRKIRMAHSSRDTDLLFDLLMSESKFPYEDPLWYMLKNVKSCYNKNPSQKSRLANSLYAMTDSEVIIRLESAPKINTQIGPMFGNWLKNNFNSLSPLQFELSEKGLHILDATEQVAMSFVKDKLGQNLKKRPDLVAKNNNIYIIGEAKWIGQPGGNQEKQVQEVINFCKDQRHSVRRVGIIDGFPWALYNTKDTVFENKESVYVQESVHDLLSALLLKEYLLSIH